MIAESYKIAAMALTVVPALFVLLTVTFDLSSAIEVTEVTFTNTTQHSFTAAWAYRLNGYNASRLQGFALVVSSVFDFEIIVESVAPNQTAYATPWVESGNTFHVCIAPTITGATGNQTCGIVTTQFDAWDTRGQLALYISVALLVTLVVLVSWDMYKPRTPSGGDQREAKRKSIPQLENRPTNLQSNIQLTDNMH